MFTDLLIKLVRLFLGFVFEIFFETDSGSQELNNYLRLSNSCGQITAFASKICEYICPSLP